jgi:large repetitive protein
MDNDSDPDGDPLTLVSCSVSVQGAQVTNAGDRCTYKHPDPDNWTEPDTFTYVISDGNGGTATGTVTVTPR